MMSIHGQCKHCGESIYPDDEYTSHTTFLYHIECAEQAGIEDEEAKRQGGAE